MAFDAPMNSKSWAIATGPLSANTIYRLDRVAKAIVAPSYATDTVQTDVVTMGVELQNRTQGDLVIWYGQLPSAFQVPSEFAKAGYKIASGGTYRPNDHQLGMMYMLFSNPSAGYIHHILH